MNIVWENFGFFFENLKNLSVSKSLNLSNKNFCVSTGCDLESWVYYPEKNIAPEDVENVIKFFNEQNISFLWPVYGNGEEVLKSSGLFYAGDLTAMKMESNLSVDKSTSTGVEKPLCHLAMTSPLSKGRLKPIEKWAKTVWEGFDGNPDEIPENYFSIVESLSECKNFSLYVSTYEGKEAGTFLLTHGENVTGVYYFATLPKFRRKGIARAMMSEICRLSSGKTIVLQATPSGVPFYKNFGFEELFTIPVYSNENDIW